MDVKGIINELDKYVHGQDEAKKAIAGAVFLHLLDIDNFNNGRYFSNGNKPTIYRNILLTGNSGSGKTLIVRTISKLFDMPLAEIDASTLTPAGYHGDTAATQIAEKVIEVLDAAKSSNAEKKLIVFFDEFDKVTSMTGDAQVKDFKSSVQYELLKFVETQPEVLFIFAGNYPQLRREVKNIGFGKKSTEEVFDKEDLTESLQKIGVASQLAGRIRFFASLDKLTEDDYIHILESPDMVVKDFKTFAKAAGKNFTLSPIQIKSIAKSCAKSDMGARGLHQSLSDRLLKIISDVDIDEEINPIFSDKEIAIKKDIAYLTRQLKSANKDLAAYAESVKNLQDNLNKFTSRAKYREMEIRAVRAMSNIEFQRWKAGFSE